MVKVSINKETLIHSNVHEHPSAVVIMIDCMMGFFVAFMIVVFLLVSLRLYRRIKSKKTANLVWEDNTCHKSEDSEGGYVDENDSSFNRESLDDDEPILPGWLKARKEMVYPQRSIEKGKQLGSGQFGEVFKGRLVQGTAVYVHSFSNLSILKYQHVNVIIFSIYYLFLIFNLIFFIPYSFCIDFQLPSKQHFQVWILKLLFIHFWMKQKVCLKLECIIITL